MLLIRKENEMIAVRSLRVSLITTPLMINDLRQSFQARLSTQISSTVKENSVRSEILILRTLSPTSNAIGLRKTPEGNEQEEYIRFARLHR